VLRAEPPPVHCNSPTLLQKLQKQDDKGEFDSDGNTTAVRSEKT